MSWDNIASLAGTITGSADEIAGRIAALILQHDPRADGAAIAAPEQRWHTRIEAERRQEEIRVHQYRLALDFGNRSGWRLSPSPFNPQTLSLRRMHGGPRQSWGTRQHWPHEYADHRYFYRSADRRAAALVAHPYGLKDAERQAAAIRWAGERGLLCEFPDDFPSWWFPGSTTLIVFRPAEPEGRS